MEYYVFLFLIALPTFSPGKEFHIIRLILKNGIKILFPLILVSISCNVSPKKRPFFLLARCSGLNFNHKNTVLLDYKEEMAGFAKDRGIIQAVFRIEGLNMDSLKTELMRRDYKKLPIGELDMGDGFHGNVRSSDSGFYKLNLLHRSIIDVLIIVNFTQRKIVLYKLI